MVGAGGARAAASAASIGGQSEPGGVLEVVDERAGQSPARTARELAAAASSSACAAEAEAVGLAVDRGRRERCGRAAR